MPELQHRGLVVIEATDGTGIEGTVDIEERVLWVYLGGSSGPVRLDLDAATALERVAQLGVDCLEMLA